MSFLDQIDPTRPTLSSIATKQCNDLSNLIGTTLVESLGKQHVSSEIVHVKKMDMINMLQKVPNRLVPKVVWCTHEELLKDENLEDEAVFHHIFVYYYDFETTKELHHGFFFTQEHMQRLRLL